MTLRRYRDGIEAFVVSIDINPRMDGHGPEVMSSLRWSYLSVGRKDGLSLNSSPRGSIIRDNKLPPIHARFLR